MKNDDLLLLLNQNYPLSFTKIEPLREGGSATYAAYTDKAKYFAKVVGAAFSDTLTTSVEINLYLQSKGFSVPSIVLSTHDKPFVINGQSNIILYKFIETAEIDMDKDAEAVGALLGQLHSTMRHYTGKLVTHDREFYLDRYIQILKKKQYAKADEFSRFGESLWERLKSLPRGYSHGDMYCGNIERGTDGKLYVLDFDTSCIGFSMYDLALICNQTDYFKYDVTGLPKTTAIYKHLLPEYLKFNSLTEREVNSIYDMLALYHFALQATIIEIYGLDCVDDAFFDRQLRWLTRWQEQCDANALL